MREELDLSGIKAKIILITGLTRAGKTSSAVAMVRKDKKHNLKKRMAVSAKKVAELNKRGFKGLKLGEHLYYSNFRLQLPYFLKKKYTYYVDFDKLGLPNEDYKTMNLQYGSVVVIDEPDAKLNSRNSKSSDLVKGFNDYIHGFLKFHGQLGVTLILITQDPSRLEVIFRNLLHEIIYITNKKDKHFFGLQYKTIWEFIHYRGLRQAIKLGLEGELPHNLKDFKGLIDRKKLTYWGNVHKYYDHEAYLNLFLFKGMEYDLVEHSDPKPTADEIAEYNKKYSYVSQRQAKQNNNG